MSKTHFDYSFKIRIAYVVLSGAFLFYVLFAFKAFNIDQGESLSGDGLLFRALSFGLLFSTVLAFFEFFLYPRFALNTPQKTLLWYAAEWSVSTFAVFWLFNYFWNYNELQLSSLSLLSFEMAMVMIIPIGFRELVFYFSKKSFRVSEQIKSDLTKIKFTSENGKEELVLDTENYMYLAASANYVEVHYLHNQNLEKRLLRTSLKRIEDDPSIEPHLLRIHRSYIVNPSNIKKYEIKKGKMTIDLGYAELKVSPNFEEDVKRAL